MKRVKIGLLTTDPDFLGSEDRDIAILSAALARDGYKVDCPVWHDVNINWSSYDLLVMKSPWDYPDRYDEFMNWLDATSKATKILNAPDLIRWNIDKRYLTNLSDTGVDCVPYTFCLSIDEVMAAIASYKEGTIIIKPSVSAGSMNTGWFKPSDPNAVELAKHILELGKTVMVQPAVEHVTRYGENALFFLNGQYSYSFHKNPILTLGGGYIGGKYTEDIVRGFPIKEEIRLGEQTVRAINKITKEKKFSEDAQRPLYARVDVALEQGNIPQVLEVELFEPAYFVDVVPEATDMFVAAVRERATEF